MSCARAWTTLTTFSRPRQVFYASIVITFSVFCFVLFLFLFLFHDVHTGLFPIGYGAYQFHPTYNQEEVCAEITSSYDTSVFRWKMLDVNNCWFADSFGPSPTPQPTTPSPTDRPTDRPSRRPTESQSRGFLFMWFHH